MCPILSDINRWVPPFAKIQLENMFYTVIFQKVRHCGQYDSEAGEIRRQPRVDCSTTNVRVDGRETKNRFAAVQDVATVSHVLHGHGSVKYVVRFATMHREYLSDSFS